MLRVTGARPVAPSSQKNRNTGQSQAELRATIYSDTIMGQKNSALWGIEKFLNIRTDRITRNIGDIT